MKIADNKEKTLKIEAKLTKYAQKHRTMKIQLEIPVSFKRFPSQL